MKTKSVFISLFLALFISKGNAQISDEYKYQYFKEKLPKESFVYLGISYFDFFDIKKGNLEITNDFEEQILLLDNNAFQLSKRSVDFNQFSKINFIEATCYFPSKNKYKKEVVKDFKENEAISTGVSFYADDMSLSFRFENIKEGAVTSIKYRKKILEPRLLHRKSFTQQLYKAKQSYVIKVHEDIDLGFETFNLDELEITFQEKKEGKYKIYQWEAKEIERKTIYGDDDYQSYITPEIIPYIKSYKVNGETITIFRNLDDLYAWYASLIKKIPPTEKTNLKELADSITQGATTEIEKVQKIYYWVQDEIKYIAFGDGYGGFIPRSPDQILERRFGDCKDMSCLTISLLNELGITAYFTWVGTRSIPYGYTQLFTPQVDNHMIATYFDENGKIYFLDATNPYLTFGIPSSFIQGKEVMVGLDEKTYKIIEAPIVPAKLNKDFDSVIVSLIDGNLVGKGIYSVTGYQAEKAFELIKETEEKDLIKLHKRILSKGSNKFNMTDFSYYRPKDVKDSLLLNYDFEIEDYSTIVDQFIYINLNLSKDFKEFKLDTKQNIPLFFDYLFSTKKKFKLIIPEEYELIYTPEDVTYDSPYFNYTITYTKSNQSVDYHLDFMLKEIQIEVAEIDAWNKAIASFSKNLDESIKLIKK